VVLAGVSGLVPESPAALLREQRAPSHGAAALPPGLYDSSPRHLVHVMNSGGKNWASPAGSETGYVLPSAVPFQPQFFSVKEFRIVTRFVEILLGNVHPAALSQTTQWFD